MEILKTIAYLERQRRHGHKIDWSKVYGINLNQEDSGKEIDDWTRHLFKTLPKDHPYIKHLCTIYGEKNNFNS